MYWYSRHLCLIDWGVHLSSIHRHCTRSNQWVLTVCKTSVLNSLGSTYAGLHCAMLMIFGVMQSSRHLSLIELGGPFSSYIHALF